MARTDPSTKSIDASAMEPRWRMVDDILSGGAAIRAGGETYLPRFPEESRENYAHRLRTALFVNLYADIVENLAQRPFAKPLRIVETSAAPRIRELAEDIDGEGNNLHVFAQEVFFAGINHGVDFLIADFTRLPDDARTVADERALGARPYIRRIAAPRVLGARTATIEGREQFVHFRYSCDAIVQDGFDEKLAERVMVLERKKAAEGLYENATFALLEKRQKEGRFDHEWVVIDSGLIGIGRIPVVAYVAGRRKGKSWQVSLPMGDAADLQIEHYQAESKLKIIKDLACFPMLCGEGITPAEGKNGRAAPLPTGPGAVLYAPAGSDGKSGTWKFIEPTANSLRLLADDIDRLEKQLRELGRQPLTAQTGNLTVVTTAFAAAKGNSAIEAWALGLKDALEQALAIFAEWLGDASKPELQLNLDFASAALGENSFADVMGMRKAGDLSLETLHAEAKRRGVLAPDFNHMTEKDRLRDENPDPDTEDDVEAALSGSVVPFNRTA